MPLNYAGPHGLLSLDSMSLRFFHKLGATKLFRGALCGAVRSEAWAGTYGTAPGIGPEAAAHADLNLVWGNNATVTNLHLVRAIWEAKRKGGRLAVIDPLRTKIAERADLHLALRPGTDVVLGFALARRARTARRARPRLHRAPRAGLRRLHGGAREWSAERAAEVCGVPAEQIRTLAGWMAEARRLVLSPGNGLERGRNGGSGDPRRDRAAGADGQARPRERHRARGAATRFRRTPDRLTRPDLAPAGTRTLNIKDVGRHLETRRHRSAAARAVHLQPQPDRGASGPEPHEARARARGRVSGRHRDRHDGKHAALRHRAAGRDAFRMRRSLRRLRAPLAAARRAGDPAAGRGAAQHRDLPQTRGALRLHRRLLFGERPGADRRRGRRRGRAPARHAAERDSRSLADGRRGGTAARAVRQCACRQRPRARSSLPPTCWQALGRGGAAADIPAACG